MQLVLILGTILVPICMFVLRHRPLAAVFDLIAALSVLLANIAAGLAVLEIKQESTEFTTHVHEIFMDPLFLVTTGYIGVYSVYRLLVATSRTWQAKRI
ncbi:transposase [Tumebacillus permanentifrigoris]|uniref:Uncharacterized protein n=1 Tax=Tumebacillus permanentifrigoris TaxID=378543 RepID=A0A316D8H7_9BACL|nr:transposase [Tumebacillus permanentifrigoris]PWK13153.1 hypothetical protein C7459_108173 [Tumebacillus permanentifrigoris]